MDISFELHRKIKAVLFIAMLAGAEVQQALQSTKHTEAAERTAKEIDLKVAEPSVQAHAKRIASQIDAMLTNPEILDQAKNIAKQMEALMAVPNVKEQVRAVAEKGELMNPEMNFEEQAKLFAKQMEALQADPNFQEQAKYITEQMKMMLANPNFQKQGKLVIEQIEAMMADPGLQEWAKMFVAQTEKMMSSPQTQEHESNMVDKMLDKIVVRILKTSPLDQAGMENTVLGKSASMGVQPSRSVKSFTAPASSQVASQHGLVTNQLQRRPLIRPPGTWDASGSAFRTSAFQSARRGRGAVKNRVPEPEEENELISEELQETLNEVTYLFVRLAVASVMVHHGYEKFFSAELFTKYAIDKYFNFLPGPHIFWTYSVGGVQFFAPFLMALGVFSRVASASLAGVMLGATFQSVLSTGLEGYPLSKMASRVPIFHNYGFELPIVYVCIFLLFTASGPGKYSVAQALGWNDDKSLFGKLKQ